MGLKREKFLVIVYTMDKRGGGAATKIPELRGNALSTIER
jgi:hypothetical protein